jgi:PAS domain S-box-containing protein
LTDNPTNWNEQQLRELIDTAPDAVVVVDDSGLISFVNLQTEGLFGYDREELKGRPLDMLIPERFRHAHAGHLGGYLKAPSVRGMSPSLDLFGLRSDGTEFPVEVSLSPLTVHGRVWVSAAIRDVSDRKRIQEELREARRAAEAGSAAKSEFLSSMSHELRTPLNAVLGFAQLLQRDKKERLSDRHRERVDHILRGGEHLLRLIDDILDLSRIEVGAVTISTEPVLVRDVIEEVCATLGPTAARAQVELLGPGPSPNATVLVDRTRFAQILMNFGTNAIKYNRPRGKVTFELESCDVGCLRVTVRDTGIGIPKEQQDKLFLPFQRAGQETGPIEGTGIGLAITKRLAELMNGCVGFESVAGLGSAFWVQVPARDTVLTKGSVTDGGVNAPSLGGARGLVLYVEDNPANVEFMKDLLGSFEGIELVALPTAEMGVDVARTRQPKVIIMDVNLPGMSGFEALELLAQDPTTAHIPVIALTAAAEARDRIRGEQAGFHRYLTKPVQVDALEAALEPLLRPSR